MNIHKNISLVYLFLATVMPVPLSYAADIDIYSRPPLTTSDPNLNPNILIVIDNSANWAAANQGWPGGIKQGESELRALREVIGSLSDNVNVGLMMFTGEAGGKAYVRFHVRPMNSTNKSAFAELVGNPSGCTDGFNSLNGTPNCILKNFNTPTEKTASAKTDYSAAMLEVFKYFGGYTWPAHAQDDVAGANVNAGQFGTLRYAGNPDPKMDAAAYSTDANKTSYVSPLTTANSCAKNYIIFIGNGFPSQDSPSTMLGPPSLLPTQGVGGDVSQLPLANLINATTTQTVLLANPACGTYPGATATDSLNVCSAKAGGAVTITIASPAVFTRTAHGFAAGDKIRLSTTGTLPNGLATLTDYYVIATGLTANTFQVSLSAGGAAVNTTGTQSGTHTASNLQAIYPGYSNYSCSSAASCSAGSTNIVDTPLPVGAASPTVCGLYSTASACATALSTRFPGYTSYSCTGEASCSYTTTRSPTYVGMTGCIAAANASSCEAWAASNPAYNTLYSGFNCSNSSSCGSGNKDWQLDASFDKHSGKTYSMIGTTTTTVTTPSYSQNITATKTYTAFTPDGTFSAPTKINYFDEWARFLRQTDTSPAPGQQSATTFTIDVFKDHQDGDETSLLISAAAAGGGKYFRASDETAIKNALNKIFSEIQSVNSVFASSSLPVSVNTQGTYLNQVFMGMFRPEGSAAPRWPGNLKQYKFKIFNGVLRLADKNGDEAISTTTGFITPCADSFWTTDTGQYWNFGASQALGGCGAQFSAFPAANSTSVYSDAPDGEVVEKGGAAQRLRGVYSSAGTLVSSSTNYDVCTGTNTPETASCRILKTCDGSSTSSCTTLTNFDTANTSVTGALSNSLIWWTRGKDVDNENANLDVSLAPIYNEMRPSVHGGVVHSQPAVIDFGGSIGTMAFYGADDGMFHAVHGNQSDTDGTELWGFIAPETYSKLYRLRDNGNDSDGDGISAALIAFPGITSTFPVPTPKDYFFDGSIGVYQKSGTVWIYPSMRRGGRSIYAFDVSDPYSPVLKWRKGCFTSNTTDDTSCSSGWTDIGQTWSSPTVAYLSGYVDGSGNQKPVLVFGGGYDECEDVDSQTRCTSTPRKGANIWFVDANSGTVLRTYPTNYSVPGDVAILKDGNGNLTSVYAADTGGNVYRINVGATDNTGTVFTSWTNNSTANNIILASLSETNHARKFINGPTVVPSPGFNAVLIGSGDREHPLVTNYACGNYSTTAGNYVTNQFYMLIDLPTGYPSPTVTTSALVDVTSGTTSTATVSGTTTITNVTGGVTTTSTKGWKFNYGQCEQTVNEALTIAGSTYFGTNTPSSTTGTSCVANLGIARGYAVDYLTGNAAYSNRSGVYVGGGMPPSPVAGVVDVDGTKVPFCIGCNNPDDPTSSALQGGKVVINPTGSRYRPYWYMEGD